MRKKKFGGFASGGLCVAFFLLQPAMAADDEIMVTDGDLAPVGKPELEVHNNVSQGSSQSPGAGVFAPNHVARVTPELSIGLSPHWDAGLYLMTSWVPGRGLYFDGVRLRAKFIDARESADALRWYYGMQFEFADVGPGVSPDRTSVEVKAIAGAELGGWEAAINLLEQRDVPDRGAIDGIFRIQLHRCYCHQL